MAHPLLRIVLIVVFCAVATAGSLIFPEGRPATSAHAAAPTTNSLSIGGKAPELDVEHWVSDGNGFFEPVSSFENGKIYVVEFWATWCGPCAASIPRLAELQKKYRGQDVQIVGISDEPLSDINAFLKREVQSPTGPTTFGELTSAYCLTTDPDRSAYTGYMEAAGQDGIPTAFVVGKSGLIEWIGFPTELEEPLDQLINDSWDREAFRRNYEAQKQYEIMMQRVSELAGTGKATQAIELIDKQLSSDLPEAIRKSWVAVRQQVKLISGLVDDEVVAYFKQEMASNKGDAVAQARLAIMLFQTANEVSGLDELLKAVAAAMEAEIPGASADILSDMHDILAHVYESSGKIDEAIKHQEQAVELTVGRAKQRSQAYLEELKASQK